LKNASVMVALGTAWVASSYLPPWARWLVRGGVVVFLIEKDHSI